jgi:NAD(P)H-dependent flavin oxidoreductase YrpB (nitropropane dioxygenase family)
MFVDLLDRLRIDHPVAQAGMSTIAPASLASAVAVAGGLGTIGTCAPPVMAAGIDQVRQEAPGRAVAVNLLMPFISSGHVEVCLSQRIDVAVLAFGGDRHLIERLHQTGAMVLVMVGTEEHARTAVNEWGADGLIAQGSQAGGHLAGRTKAHAFLATALAVAGNRPVLLAGGVAEATDTRAALQAGASAVVAGTRFLLTPESAAHPAYQQRVLEATATIRTTLFGLGWPTPHRVVANAATRRWCRPDGSARSPAAQINRASAVTARVAPRDIDERAVLRLQRPELPMFTPAAITKGLPAHWIERCALYAGESATRIHDIVPAARAVALLTP